MTAPNLQPRLVLPTDSDIPITYDELIETISCLCSVGGVVQPSTLPSATINLGDVLANQANLLSAFTSMYGFIAAILRIISCIMDVVCALVNPFSTIKAVIRLFGTCLPDLILIFPQLTIPAIIICIIKIILAIVEYILTVIVPILEEIIQDTQDLIDAFAAKNADAQAAVAFKLASLFKELFNILGILNTLEPILEMIKTLLNMGVNLPCGGSGGSCDGCGDDQCPEVLLQTEITGDDGILVVVFGSDPTEFQILFNSPSNLVSFLTIKDFFPKGLDYNEIKDEDDFPYTLETGGNTYGVSSIDSGGNLSLVTITPELSSDGYLDMLSTGLGADEVHFGSPTGNFLVDSPQYLTIADPNPSNLLNNGTWEVTGIYDANNVKLIRDDGNSWTASNPTYWRIAPTAPSSGTNLSFTFGINHTELIRHGLIGLGCHPAVKAEIEGLEERFSEVADNYGDGLGLPDFPDLTSVIDDLESAIIVPKNVTTDYILDNYGSFTPEAVAQMGTDIEDILNAYKGDLENYAQEVYPRLFDPENSTLEATPLLQVIGEPVVATLVAIDRFGGVLGSGFSDNIVDAEIFANQGDISSTEPVLDENGTPTGEFQATLTSANPLTVTLTGTVAGIALSDYLGNQLVPKEVQVEFVTAAELQRRRGIAGEVSAEPLGKVRSE